MKNEESPATINPDSILEDNFKTDRTFPQPDYPVETHFLRMSLLSMHMVRWHWHEEIELILIKTGSALVKTEVADIILTSGQGLILNQNLLHSIHTAGDKDCSLYSLRFHTSFLFGSQDNALSSKYLIPVTSSPHFKYLLLDQDSQTSQLLRPVKQIICTDLTKPLGYELEVRSCLDYIWRRLLYHVTAKAPDAPRQQPANYDGTRIKTAIRYIEEHHAEPISLEEIADSIHISKSECCRCFRRTLGMTPFEYLIKYRIFESARKMQKKEAAADTISDLAASVGFNSPSYYNKIFKKFLGCTPLEYKRRIAHSSESPITPDKTS